jgi:gas vesicle protein
LEETKPAGKKSIKIKLNKLNDMSSKKFPFIEGAVIGAALGMAAGLFLQSKKGKELQKGAKEKAATFFAYISPKLKNMKEMGEKEFSEFIEKAAKTYAKARKFTDAELKTLIIDAKSTWKHLKKHAS